MRFLIEGSWLPRVALTAAGTAAACVLLTYTSLSPVILNKALRPLVWLSIGLAVAYVLVLIKPAEPLPLHSGYRPPRVHLALRIATFASAGYAALSFALFVIGTRSPIVGADSDPSDLVLFLRALFGAALFLDLVFAWMGQNALWKKSLPGTSNRRSSASEH
jgi:hypothetical protein